MNQPTIYLYAAKAQKIEPPLAVYYSIDFAKYFQEEAPRLNPGKIIRPVDPPDFKSVLSQAQSDPLCRAVIRVSASPKDSSGRTSKRKVQLYPLLISSIMDQASLPQTLFEHLDFQGLHPRWLTFAQSKFLDTLKKGISVIQLELGVYDTVSDFEAIKKNLPNVSKALGRALDEYLGGGNPPNERGNAPPSIISNERIQLAIATAKACHNSARSLL